MASERDLLVIAPLVLGVILIVLIVLLRALVAPLYLLATVVLSYLGTLGLSLLAFDVIFGRDGVDTLLPILAFIFLVALGVDYNIFLMSRVREEAALRGTQEGILRGIVSTGPVITSAGLILAGTFIVLTTLPVWLLFELGFTVALGVLIDTFLVRSAIVPAITSLLGDRAWWPSKPEAGGVVPAGSSPTIEVPALLGARKGVEILPAGLGAAGELVARANSDAERVELQPLAEGTWLARWSGRETCGIRVLTLGPHAELERQNLAVRDLAGATGDRLPHLGLYRGEDDISLLRQRVTGREPVMTLAERLAEDAARPEQAAATIDALLRLKLARWHFELARPPEPAELALSQLTGIEARRSRTGTPSSASSAAPRSRPRSPRRASRSPTSSARSPSSPTTSSARCSARSTARCDGDTVLVDVNGRMELTGFGRAGIRWRALDFLSLECALKFDLAIQQVDDESLMRMERALETHGPDDRPRALALALGPLPHGRRLATSAACVATVRKAALEAGAGQRRRPVPARARADDRRAAGRAGRAQRLLRRALARAPRAARRAGLPRRPGSDQLARLIERDLGRLAAHRARAVELLPLEHPHALDLRRDHEVGVALTRARGVDAAERHRAQERLADARHRLLAAGEQAPERAPQRLQLRPHGWRDRAAAVGDVDRDDRPLGGGRHRLHREVVHDAAVDEQAAVAGRHRRVDAGDGEARVDRLRRRAGAVDDELAGEQVG